MKEKIVQLQQRAISEISVVTSTRALNDLKVKYLGKSGEITELLKGMKHFRNSDAHYLENMVEASVEIELPECSAQEVINYIRNGKAG